ncbi:MAG: glycosyltransferase, partial [Methylocystis sp.]|nr:glycosyltransferase [Methylocystis sp.]
EQGWKLALAGGKGLGWEQIHETAGKFDGVELLGFVSDDELAWLYANAAAFAYPSYLEGFGLPLLEAMANGLPCLASITGASREVCGDLGVLVDPYHMNSVVQGLVDCANASQNHDQAAAARLMARAREFSFDRYLGVLRSALPH